MFPRCAFAAQSFVQLGRRPMDEGDGGLLVAAGDDGARVLGLILGRLKVAIRGCEGVLGGRRSSSAVPAWTRLLRGGMEAVAGWHGCLLVSGAETSP